MKRLTTSYRTTAPTQPDVAASEIDITTLSLLRGSLRSVANEMDTVLRLTAFSPIIAEGNDRASGIYDGRGGGVVAQGEDGLPLFIGNMQFTVMHVLREVAELSPGDVNRCQRPLLRWHTSHGHEVCGSFLLEWQA